MVQGWHVEESWDVHLEEREGTREYESMFYGATLEPSKQNGE